MNCRLRLSLLIIAAVLGACATTPRDSRDNSSIAAIQDELESLNKASTTAAAPPAQIDDALLPPLLTEGPSGAEERFDVAVNGIAATDFFMGLVKGTDYNMVVHPKVSGDISLELNDVSIEEVMQVVREVYGYPWKRRDNLFQVMPGGIRSEVFQLDYLSLKRHGISEIQVVSGEVRSAGESSTGNNSNDGNNNSSNSNSSSNGGTIGAQIRTETESDFWTELQDTLKVLIGNGDGRSVVVTPQAGIVVARAMPEEIEIVREYLRRAELIMRRQVVLEAKILEVQLSEGYQAGVDWTAFTTPRGNTLNFGVSGSPTTSPNGIGGAFGAVFESGDFSGAIELLETQGSVQVLSSPRISTVNNQKAVIKVGQDEFFVTEVSNTTTTSSGGTTNSPEVQLTPFFSGIALDVTPQISEDDEIILHIHPSISEVEDQSKPIAVGDQLFQLPLALSTIRETDSVVYAHSGQVVVLGGLMQNKSVDSNSGAPGLARTPILGHLFSQQRNQTVKSELVILLRPIIMGPDGLRDGNARSRKRFDQFRRELDSSYRNQMTGGQ